MSNNYFRFVPTDKKCRVHFIDYMELGACIPVVGSVIIRKICSDVPRKKKKLNGILKHHSLYHGYKFSPI